MIKVFYSEVGKLAPCSVEPDEFKAANFDFKDKWIHLLSPTEEELSFVSNALKAPEHLLKAPLDEEERAHLDEEDDVKLIVIDIPTSETVAAYQSYTTIPMGILIADKTIVTVCLKETSVINRFIAGNVKGMDISKRTRFAFQVLFNTSTRYLTYLRQIDKASDKIQGALHISQKNKELIQLLDLEKALVYFSTSIRSNDVIIDKLIRSDFLKKYEEDVDLLEDVAIENKQAIEMSNIYRDILSGTMDAFASVISNNLNIVMKILTSITILLAVPTAIASFFGMNVGGVPAQGKLGFLFVFLISMAVSCIAGVFLYKKKLL